MTTASGRGRTGHEVLVLLLGVLSCHNDRWQQCLPPCGSTIAAAPITRLGITRSPFASIPLESKPLECMIEPKYSFHILRPEAQASQQTLPEEGEEPAERIIEHDEPDNPIHPALEYEILHEGEDSSTAYIPLVRTLGRRKRTLKNDAKLLASFICLIIFGSCNTVFMKLQAIPMYNYPNFLNLFVNLLFVPICFAYIIPVARYGWFGNAITQEQLDMPKRPFIVMGALDCLATSMQVFASVYLPGPLIVLLPQTAIPLSLVLTRYMLKERYSWLQYMGAAVVIAGIGLIMEPVLTNRHAPSYKCEAFSREDDCIICQSEMNRDDCLSHRTGGEFSWVSTLNDTDDTTPDDALCQWLPFRQSTREEEMLIFMWSFVMIASCLPMTISTIYKEAAMVGETEVDPVYINGSVAFYQFFFNLVLAVPAGYLFSPMIRARALPENLWDGLKCYLGESSVHDGCHPDLMCSFHAAFFVNANLVTTVLYAIFMMYVIKYGNTSLLFLALTVMVPIGNLAFTMPFMPQATKMHDSDIWGLVVIMAGLVLYRFSASPAVEDDESVEGVANDRENDFPDVTSSDAGDPGDADRIEGGLREPLLHGDI